MRLHVPLLLACLLAALPSRAGGLNLSWDHCRADGTPVTNRNFACDTNAGEDILVASFNSSLTYTGLTRFATSFEFLSFTAAELPAWWNFDPAAHCRPVFQFFGDAPGPSACVPLANLGATTPVLTSWVLATLDTRRARMQLVSTVPLPGATVFAGQEYMAVRIAVSHLASVGPGACAGCSRPVAIAFSSVSGSPATLTLLLGATPNSNIVNWQHDAPTAVRRVSWSAIKSLYR